MPGLATDPIETMRRSRAVNLPRFKQVAALLLIVSASPALSGCVSMLAASAINEVAQSVGTSASNQALQPKAREACIAQAAQYGTVHVSVVEQPKIDQIIVWGTVDDGKQARSFECDFATKITGFTLHQISTF